MLVIYALTTIFLRGGAGLRVVGVRRAWPDASWLQAEPQLLWQLLLRKTAARGLDLAVVAQAIILCSGAVMMAVVTVANRVPAVAAERVRPVGATGGALCVVFGTAGAVMIAWQTSLLPLSRHRAGTEVACRQSGMSRVVRSRLSARGLPAAKTGV